jgi:hypothetical protein
VQYSVRWSEETRVRWSIALVLSLFACTSDPKSVSCVDDPDAPGCTLDDTTDPPIRTPTPTATPATPTPTDTDLPDTPTATPSDTGEPPPTPTPTPADTGPVIQTADTSVADPTGDTGLDADTDTDNDTDTGTFDPGETAGGDSDTAMDPPSDSADTGGSGIDFDGDGFSTARDCNDADASVNPGATEVWYDGVDQDCSGGSDYDQDGDGQNSDLHGGLDCDDTEARVTQPGETLRVVADFDTLDEAIDAACPNSTILVFLGLYDGPFTLPAGKNLTLRAGDVNLPPRLRATGAPVLTVEEGTVADVVFDGGDAGCLHVTGTADVSDVVLDGCERAGPGGAVWIDGATASLSGLDIDGAEGGDGAAIAVTGASTVDMTEVTVTGSVGSGLGAIYTAASAEVTGSRITLIGNDSTDSGGLHAESTGSWSDLTLSDNTGATVDGARITGADQTRSSRSTPATTTARVPCGSTSPRASPPAWSRATTAGPARRCRPRAPCSSSTCSTTPSPSGSCSPTARSPTPRSPDSRAPACSSATPTPPMSPAWATTSAWSSTPPRVRAPSRTASSPGAAAGSVAWAPAPSPCRTQRCPTTRPTGKGCPPSSAWTA